MSVEVVVVCLSVQSPVNKVSPLRVAVNFA
jgi:hypothetical protein